MHGTPTSIQALKSISPWLKVREGPAYRQNEGVKVCIRKKTFVLNSSKIINVLQFITLEVA